MAERKMAKKIVGRKYVVVEEQPWIPVGAVVTLIKDNDRVTARFKDDRDGGEWYLTMDKVLLLAEDKPEQPELEKGKIYFADQAGHWEFDWIAQVSSVEGCRVEHSGCLDPDGTDYSAEGWINLSGAKWTEATPEQKIKLLQAKVEHGDATETDLELLSQLMPLDNPELEIGEVYVCDGDIVRADVGDTVESGLTGNYYDPIHKNFIEKDGEAKWLIGGYRKALPHEIAKLEALEKEHGCEYQKPLINKLGTVIEVGKYYKTSGELLKVTEITDLKVIYDGYKMPSREKPNTQVSQVNSFFFHELQPATPAEIEQFKEAEAREKLPKFEVGKSYTVWHSTFDCSVITVTRVDYCCNRVTFKYKGKFGSYVSETQKISSKLLANVTEVD